MSENIKLTVAFITPKMIVGGAEQYIITKSDWLVKRGHRVVVLSEGGENVANLPAGVVHYVVSNICASPHTMSSKDVKRIVDEISGIVTAEGVTVIEAQNPWPIYYTAFSCAETGVPYLYNLLNELSHKCNPFLAVLVRRFSKWGRYYTLLKNMNDYVERHIYSRLKAKIIPITVASVPVFSDRAEDYILSVCRFSSEKMYVLHLIEGFAEACARQALPVGMKLVVVGDGELRGEVRRAADACNRALGREAVEMRGTLTGEALFRLYDGCCAYVGMGTTVLLAAQYAKPIVRVGSWPQTMPWAWGFWGERPERDKDELGACSPTVSERMPYDEALSLLMDKERAADMGRMAFDLYRRHYDLESIMLQWELEYRDAESVGRQIGKLTLMALSLPMGLLRGAKKLYDLVRK